MKWYYRDGDKSVGPLTENSIRELLACGMISDATEVRDENSDAWVRFDQVFGGAGQSNRTPEEEHPTNLIKFHCPQCQQKISADPEQENQSVQCPSCGADFVVPSRSREEEVPPLPPAALHSVPVTPSASGLGDALKNLFGSLAALCGTLLKSAKSAATSEAAQQAKQKVAETSTMLRTRASEMASAAANSEALKTAAEKINKGAAEIQKKAADLTHQSGEQAADLSAAPPPHPNHTDATASGLQGNDGSASLVEPNRRTIKWLTALAFFGLSTAFMVCSDLAYLDGSLDESAMIFMAGLPMAILAASFLGILQFKCWNTLPPAFRATTPGKAVGCMFIPFFNFYWCFITWPKLSEGLASWQRSAGINTTNTKGLGITFAILFVLNCVFTLISVPALAVLIKIAMLVIFILYYLKLVRGLNQMLGASAAASAPIPVGFWNFKRTAIGIGVTLPLYWIILGATYEPEKTPSSYGSEGYTSGSFAPDDHGSSEYSFNQGDKIAIARFNETYSVTHTIGKRNGSSEIEILIAAVDATDWSGASQSLRSAVNDFKSIRSGESPESRTRKVEPLMKIIEFYE